MPQMTPLKDSSMMRASLVSVAMLKVNYDLDNRDYIDYLVPFVTYVISPLRGKGVVVDLVRKEILSKFGLNLPKGTIELCLKRMVKRKFLVREANQYVVSKEMPDSEMDARQADAKRDAAIVVSALVEFAKSSGREISDDQAYAAIIEYLKQFSIECLSAYVRGTPLPEIPNGKIESDVVLVSLFVKKSYVDVNGLFERVVNLVKGHMLSNALLCPDLESISKKFDDVGFYFDTPFLFRLLGLDGSAHRKLAIELVGLLRNLRGKLLVFNHTIDEISAILNFCEKHINDSRSHSQILREMRRSGKNASDIILFKNKLPELIKSNGLEIVSTPGYQHVKLQIDESAFEHLYRDEAPGIRESAIRHDINSVRSIYVLRMNVRPRRLEDAIAVFVTTNSAFSKAAYDYGMKHEASKEVTTVITDFSLSNLAWLKAPVGAPELPQREVIAYCYAALQPSSKLWIKYLDELEKLRGESAISERDHQLLRFTLKAEEELMGMTLGEDEELNGLSILQIRDRLVSEIASEKDEALLLERQKSKAVTEQLKSVEIEKNALEGRYYWIASRVGRCAGKLVWILGWPLVVLGSIIAAYFAESLHQWNWYLRAPAVGVSILILLFTILSSMYGVSLKDLRESVDKYVTQKVYGALKGNSSVRIIV